jgi:hypothetical protein
MMAGWLVGLADTDYNTHACSAGARLAALVEHASGDLALQMACGEALAVLHDAAPAVDTAVSVEFLDFLQELASESTKHKV